MYGEKGEKTKEKREHWKNSENEFVKYIAKYR